MEIGIQDASVELGTRMVLEEVTLCFRKRAITGVLGPNGAGKSTLLRALAGIVPLASGSVRLGKRDLIAMSRKEVARCVAYLSQNIEIPFPFPAGEVVMMGRYAHLSRFRSETEADHQAVARALLAVDAESLRMRPVDELSGGERQRILLARTLATEAPVLLLDEPIANLDIRHCLELLEILRDQATQGRTVVVAIHDLNFAHRFCERFVLLHGGRVLAQGTAEEVLVPPLLREAFEVEANHVTDQAGRGFFFFTRKNCDERAMSASIDKHGFSAAEREAVYRAIAERRDMRHFVPEPVAPEVLVRLLEAAHHAPSVGLTQPWRFLRITDASLRQRIHRLVEEERRHTAEALGRRQDEFLRLKVEGIAECGELLVVALTDGRERQVFGRRTLPEMDLASAACAIQNLWLAARAEGLGMGWVSMFDPQALSRLLGMPEGAKPIAILCLGHVPAFYAKPLLELNAWAQGRPLEDMVFCNAWGNVTG